MAGGAVALVTLIVANWRLVFGVVTALWDAHGQFCPYYILVADFARNGELLLWNPWSNGGSPDGFEPQVGALSPLKLGIALITGGSEPGFRFFWLTIWGLGGLGVLLLARHLRAPSWAGCIASIGYMFSFVYIDHAEHTSHLESMSFLPWIMWRLDVALQRRSRLAAAQAGTLWGLSALAGYPGLAIIILWYAFLWGVGRLLAGGLSGRLEGAPASVVGTRSRLSTFGRPVSIFLVFLVVAMIVCSPTYLGFLFEGRGFSDRAGALPRETAVESNALHPGALATFASPYLVNFKIPSIPDWTPRQLWSYTDVSSCSIYLSPVLVLLAVLGWWLTPRDAFRWWLWGLAALCLACAMGKALPVRGWLYDLLPPMRYFRHATIFRDFSMFTVVVLALLASRDLQERRRSPASGDWRAWRCLFFISLIAMGLAAAAVALTYAIADYAPPMRKLIIAHLLFAWGGVAIAAVPGWRGEDGVAGQRAFAMLMGIAVLDAILTVKLSQGVMCMSNDQRFERNRSTGLDLTKRGLDRSYGNQYDPNVNLPRKIPFLFSYASLANQYHWKLRDIPILCNSALGADRVWFAPAVVKVEWTMDHFDQLAKRSQSLGRPCLVISDPDDVVNPKRDGERPSARGVTTPETERAEPAELVPVTVRRYRPNEFIIDVVCPQKGWLLVTDRWAPGWRAKVNGVDRRLWIGNFVFRAVQVDKGGNRVSFSYHPFGHPWLLVTSWATVGAVLFLSIFVAPGRGAGAIDAAADAVPLAASWQGPGASAAAGSCGPMRRGGVV